MTGVQTCALPIYQVGVPQGLREHRPRRDGGGVGETPRQGLLYDDVLPRVRGVGGQDVMETRDHGQGHELDVAPLEQGAMVHMDVGNLEPPGEGLRALA